MSSQVCFPTYLSLSARRALSVTVTASFKCFRMRTLIEVNGRSLNSIKGLGGTRKK